MRKRQVRKDEHTPKWVKMSRVKVMGNHYWFTLPNCTEQCRNGQHIWLYWSNLQSIKKQFKKPLLRLNWYCVSGMVCWKDAWLATSNASSSSIKGTSLEPRHDIISSHLSLSPPSYMGSGRSILFGGTTIWATSHTLYVWTVTMQLLVRASSEVVAFTLPSS